MDSADDDAADDASDDDNDGIDAYTEPIDVYATLSEGESQSDPSFFFTQKLIRQKDMAGVPVLKLLRQWPIGVLAPPPMLLNLTLTLMPA